MTDKNKNTSDIKAIDKAAAKQGWRRFIPLALIVVAAAAFFTLGGGQYLTFQAISEHRETLLGWAEANRVLAVAGFMVIYVVVVALSLPGAVWLSLGGGFIFGMWINAAAAVVAATVGAVIIFLAARYAFADFFHAKAGPFLSKLEAGFNKNAFSYLLFLRLVPVFPFWLVNLVPAFLGVRLVTFTLATFIGIIPGSLVFSSIGAGLGSVFEAGREPDLGIIFEPQILGPIIALAFLSLVPVAYSHWKQKKGTDT